MVQEETNIQANDTEPLQSDKKDYGVRLDALKNIKGKVREQIQDTKKAEAITITTENLEKAWNEIANQITEKKVIYRNGILSSLVQCQNDVIEIQADLVSIDILKEYRIQLLEFFKNHYCNQKINVRFKAKPIEASTDTKTKMTSTEVYEMMVKKNPLVQKLKNDLGMDIGY
ncbi:MAG: hypothetical protein R2831_01695 [Chitinophagaceae bacterium]